MNLKKISEVTGLRLFYPSVPVVVTVRTGAKVNAMPAAWSIPLSFNPPLVAVLIAPERYTYRLITESGYFGLNWLDSRYVEQMVYIGELSGRYRQDKVSAAGLTVTNGVFAPVLREAVGALECRLTKKIETGDHDMFIGECLSAYASEDFDETWRLKSYSPILHLGSITGVKRMRRFVTLEKKIIDILCPVEEAVEKRRKTIQQIRDIAADLSRRYGRPVKLSEVAVRVMGDLGLDSIDAQLICEQLRRDGRIRVVKD